MGHPRDGEAVSAQTAQRILLVDDEENLLITLSDFLRYEGYEVREARSAEDALERLNDFVPDVIVLDLRMPGMGGETFLQRIAGPSGRPRFPVLVLTARYVPRSTIESLKVDGFLPKPCDLAELGEKIRAILTSAAPPQRPK
jgi:DNA-binding response OmpR family regulator